MPATVKATLKPEQLQDGTYAIRIRVTKDRKHAYYATSNSVALSHWNKKGTLDKENWIKTSHHNHGKLNRNIKQDVERLKDIAATYKTFSESEIVLAVEGQDKGITEPEPLVEYARRNPGLKRRKVLEQYVAMQEKQESSTGYIAYCREWIRRKQELGKDGTAGVYEVALNYLLEYTGPKPDERSLLTVGGITKFLAYLRNSKEYAVSTCNKTIGLLATMYSKGVMEGWVQQLGNPFYVERLQEVQERKPRPTENQVLSLMDVEPANEDELHARNALMLLYFMHGARVSEALLLEWDKNIAPTHISYLPKKRAKKMKHVPRHAGIEWVLEQYPRKGRFVLPYVTEADMKLSEKDRLNKLRLYATRINRNFKKLAKAAGIEMHVSSKMMRRAYSDVALKNSGDLRAVQHSIGHSSYKTTEIYTDDPMQKELDDLSQKNYASVEGRIKGKQ